MNNYNVAIYVRVSTLEQAENNWSIEGQIREIRLYCDNKSYRVVRIYKDIIVMNAKRYLKTNKRLCE